VVFMLKRVCLQTSDGTVTVVAGNTCSFQCTQLPSYFLPGEIEEVEGEDNENMCVQCVCENRLLKLETPPIPPPY